MSKINLKIVIKNEDNETKYNVLGIKSKNIIKYIEPNNTKVILDLDKNILIRENKEMLLELSFLEEKNTENIMVIKDINKKIILNIFTKSIKKNDKEYIVEYVLNETDNFIYKVDMLNN